MLADTLAQKSPTALSMIKEALEKSFDLTLKEVMDMEASNQSIALQTEEHREAVRLFLAMRGKRA